ncbi:MAG: dipeptidase [Lachnospiraceae bacterium]|nr:dipeptidase [Lachnospiraceae bacterium]
MNGFIDLHCDTIYKLRMARKEGKQVGLRSREGHIDLLRLKEAGYWMQTFAAFVDLGEEKDPALAAMELIDIFYQEMEANKDLIRPVTTADQVIENQKNGLLSALLSIEEGGVCRGNLALLRNFYRLGVRMMTLTWNYENELGWPNTVIEGGGEYLGRNNTEHGVKERGFEFLSEMERLGMLIDVSHLSDAGFYQVYDHTTKPFIASHSNARAVCSHVRNLTDDMIRKIAERGGLTGINLCASFTAEAATEEETRGTVEGLVGHIRHIADVGGIGCIGLGTDYDGIGDRVELSHCGKMPLLVDGLKKAGFHESEIDAICHNNVLRVMKDVLKD